MKPRVDRQERIDAMALEWSEKLSVDVKEIDMQHRELFKRVNRLTDAVRERKGKEEISEIIKFLETYVAEHFGTEEKYMSKHNFSSFLYHKGQHSEFINRFNDIKKRYEAQGPSDEMISNINTMLENWLLSHIAVVDRKMTSFLKAKIENG